MKKYLLPILLIGFGVVKMIPIDCFISFFNTYGRSDYDSGNPFNRQKMVGISCRKYKSYGFGVDVWLIKTDSEGQEEWNRPW